MAFCWVTTATAWPASATAGCCGGSTSCSPPAQRWWGGDTGRSRSRGGFRGDGRGVQACTGRLDAAPRRRCQRRHRRRARRTARVAAMTGIGRRPSPQQLAAEGAAEFPPVLDLVPVAFGAIGLIAAALDAAPDGGSDATIAVLRTLVGAAFLGCVTGAMLLGHWSRAARPAAPTSQRARRCSAGSGRSRSPCCCSPGHAQRVVGRRRRRLERHVGMVLGRMRDHDDRARDRHARRSRSASTRLSWPPRRTALLGDPHGVRHRSVPAPCSPADGRRVTPVRAYVQHL